MTKKIIVIACLLLFGICFCVSAEGTKESTDTVVVWVPTADPTLESPVKTIFTQMAKDWDIKYPKIHMDVQYPADWGRKIMVVMAAGNAPDVSVTYYTNQYTDNEYAVPIDDDVTAADRKDFLASQLSECSATTGPNMGKMIAWPLSCSLPYGIISVNADLFVAAGVSKDTLLKIQKEGWTADSFHTIMSKLVNQKGVFPYIPLASVGTWSMAWALQFNSGGAFDSAVNPKTEGDFPKERWFGYQGAPYENFLNFLNVLCKEKIIPPEAATMQPAALETLFFTGKVAMVDGQAWDDRARKWNEEISSGTRTGKTMDLLLLPVPKPDMQTPERAHGGFTGICVITYKQKDYKGDAHTLNARKVAQFVAHYKDIGGVAIEFAGLPASNSAVKSISGKYAYLATDPNIKFERDYNKRMEARNYFVTSWNEWVKANQTVPGSQDWWGMWGWDSVQGPVAQNVQSIILGKKDVKQAMDDMKKGVYILMENGLAKMTEEQQRTIKDGIGKW